MTTQAALRLARYAPSTAMPAHCHDAPSLNIVIDGGFHERIGTSDRTYVAGSIAYCPPHRPHAQQFGSAGSRQIIFAPKADWLTYLADCRMSLDDAPFATAPVFRSLGARIMAELSRGDAFSALACEGLLLEAVAAFGRNAESARDRRKPPAWLAGVRDVVHAGALAPLDMKAIARAAGRHEIHLAREFRRYFGRPVGAYVRTLRLEEAARRLQAPRADIATIALDCGFASHAHLCRAFKAHYGVTPSAWRLQAR